MQIYKIEKISQELSNSIIPLEDIKHFLRVDTERDDALLLSFLRGVEKEVERYTWYSIGEAKWRMVINNFSSNYFEIPKFEVKEVLRIQQEKFDEATDLEPQQYKLHEGIVRFYHHLTCHFLTVDFIAGHSDLNNMNAELVTAIKQRVLHLYENRSDATQLFRPFQRVRI